MLAAALVAAGTACSSDFETSELAAAQAEARAAREEAQADAQAVREAVQAEAQTVREATPAEVDAVVGEAAAASGGSCRSGQMLSPGDSCTVIGLSGIVGDSNQFEIQSDGYGCYGGTMCSGQSMQLNQFRAERTDGGNDWLIEPVP